MSNLIRQGDANLAAFGQFGGEVLTSGESAAEGRVVIAILSLADTTALTAETADPVTTISDGLNLGTQAIPAGVTVYGRWTKLKLGGGVAIVYYGE
tara:strand:- start:298 stop:585 length:288 start_codon:yes stop_codon:yes gene_type:complete